MKVAAGDVKVTAGDVKVAAGDVKVAVDESKFTLYFNHSVNVDLKESTNEFKELQLGNVFLKNQLVAESLHAHDSITKEFVVTDENKNTTTTLANNNPEIKPEENEGFVLVEEKNDKLVDPIGLADDKERFHWRKKVCKAESFFPHLFYYQYIYFQEG